MGEAIKENEGKLSHKQRVVARLIALGHTQAAAARLMRVHPARVTQWKKNKAFSDFLAAREEEFENRIEAAKDILKEGAPRAALKLLDLVDGEEEAIQLRASSDILDRVGVSKTQRVEAEVKGEFTLLDLTTKAKKDDKDE